MKEDKLIAIIDKLAAGIAEIVETFNRDEATECEQSVCEQSVCEQPGIDGFAQGQEVVIRTYSAGVWFGKLHKKQGNEVILTGARRMYQWWCVKSISLSGVVRHGIIREKSKICGPLDSVWLEAVEIMPIEGKAADSIRNADEVEQE